MLNVLLIVNIQGKNININSTTLFPRLIAFVQLDENIQVYFEYKLTYEPTAHFKDEKATEVLAEAVPSE